MNDAGANKPNSAAQHRARRKVLKALAVTGGATALSALPGKWTQPLLQVNHLPAFAQTSPVAYPFTNEVSVQIQRDGATVPGATWFEDQGWVGVYIPPEGGAAPDPDENRPWRRLRRRSVGPPDWAPGSITVVITLTFNAGSASDLPTGNVSCYGYGSDNNTVFTGVLEDDIDDGDQVTIPFVLPLNFIGFFFFSCFFPPIIVLAGGDQIDSSFYFGPCLYGPNSPYGVDDDQDDIGDDTEGNETADLSDFRVTFISVVYNDDGTSTWTYRLEELNPPPEVMALTFGLPTENCATLQASTPAGQEVQPDADSGIFGIQWPLEPGFTTGEFSFTLDGDVAVGLVDVAVQGDNGVVSAGTIVGPICTINSSEGVLLSNGYRITFIEAIDNGDGTSTWCYYVEELPTAQDLSNWVLALPFECIANVVSATPSPWEIVTPDPNAGINGIKWQTGAGFTAGQFKVTLAGSLNVDLVVGSVDVAAKGADLAFGTIEGPVCYSPAYP